MGYTKVNATRTFSDERGLAVPRVSRMGNPGSGTERRRWAASAETHLAGVADAARRLRRAFEAGADTQLVDGSDPAASIQDACAVLVGWLATSPAPRGLRRAGAELGAAAGVYRNAAVAFRGVAEREAGSTEALRAACSSMLDQGDHHVAAFASLVANLRD